MASTFEKGPTLRHIREWGEMEESRRPTISFGEWSNPDLEFRYLGIRELRGQEAIGDRDYTVIEAILERRGRLGYCF